MAFIAQSRTEAPRAGKRRVAVLGSTGSIGVNALDVIEALSDRLQAAALSAHSNWPLLAKQIQVHKPKWVVVTDCSACPRDPPLPAGTELLTGEEGLRQIVARPEVDIVLVAIVGAAGLLGTLAALEAGKVVAVANKETLVMAGSLVNEIVARTGATLLPVDSEHSAIFQMLCSQLAPRVGTPINSRSELTTNVERVVLTASGGPFRGKTLRELEHVTADEALRHPTWRMGPKITIDSATLMNKALEVIEAHWLFGLAPEQIEVLIHPQSIVHSFVEFKDGSVLAQLSPPDMRLPIQYALTYPERVPGPAKRLDWSELHSLTFEKPDREAFPGLELGYEVARRGGSCGVVLNAANEAAVGRFLAGSLRFVEIVRVCREVLNAHEYRARPSLGELIAADRWAREEVERWRSG
jgi:1-deoxy-D-xylulose-5-phosphate reductoisomerase